MRSKIKGFTLVEILIVLGILGLLSAITFSVVVSSKQAGRNTVDISNLRQIGQAGAIYLADYDDRMTYSTVRVCSSGYIPRPLLVSPNDPTVLGYGNEMIHNLHGVELNSKNSYISFNTVPRGAPVEQRDPVVQNTDGTVGWVVALLPKVDRRAENDTYFILPGEHFLRLRLDGGVSFKTSVWIDSSHDGITSKDFSYGSFFIDEPASPAR